MSPEVGEKIVTIILVILLALVAYHIGESNAHADLLKQCKSEERGMHLHVGEKRYFYYCSYVKP